MRLYVIALQGRVFALEADGERTVWDLKGAVAKHSNVAPPMQCISCGGKALDNGMTLRECAGAANVLTLDMSPRSLPVAVRTLAGEFDVEARTVPELRERIQQRTGINAARQRLFVDDEEHTQNGATLVQLPVGVVDVRKVSVEGMFLLVHRWGRNDTHEVSCDADDTILAVKGNLERLGFPPGGELLVDSVPLEDGLTLRECGITEGTYVAHAV
eukprot:TRINITY_DN4230_c0_g1_i1.p1 TRINITY_DN4230_c0_g1~~TRINITY_DN4230_c0_g1_i1.p1  ORF type:complete len:215 (+),score=49.33 TRINITY_DN4230_c0_g1_i1:117-761(+)